MMHPLRFPNSGIRAKVFVRKIGFKLHVMRLLRIRLFYAYVVAIGSISRCCLRRRGGHLRDVCMQRWLATARPHAGAAVHDLATYKGRSAAARARPQGGGARPWPDHSGSCRGWPAAARRLQGAVATRSHAAGA
ncbi:hypothetical protein B296_00043722, partial [Ensete ventricosum]